MPGISATGRNTATIAKVVATTASPISSAASIDARHAVLPIRMWRTMFSISTIASSTRMPATRLSASRLMLLSVKPSAFMKKNAGTHDSGIASAEISVARQSRRKNQHDDDGEKRALEQRADRRLVHVAGIFDVVVGQRDLDLRILLGNLGEFRGHLVHRLDLGPALRLLDVERGDLAAVVLDDAALLGGGVAHRRDVAEADGAIGRDRICVSASDAAVCAPPAPGPPARPRRSRSGRRSRRC